jgi:hypothetical protein
MLGDVAVLEMLRSRKQNESAVLRTCKKSMEGVSFALPRNEKRKQDAPLSLRLGNPWTRLNLDRRRIASM